MEPLETFEFKYGITGKIYGDDDALSPRKEWDNLGRMVCWHRNYNLGDEQPSGDPDDYLRQLAEEADPTVADRIDYWENGLGFAKIENFYQLHPEATTGYARSRASDGWNIKVYQAVELRVRTIIEKALEKHYITLPLYLLDHSGLSMSTGSFNDPWDSGQVGFIYLSVKAAKKEYGWKALTKARRRQVERGLEGEVETYDQYLRGDVYYYVIEDADGDTLDSCGGFFGSEYCEEELKAVAHGYEEDAAEELARQTLEEVGG